MAEPILLGHADWRQKLLQAIETAPSGTCLEAMDEMVRDAAHQVILASCRTDLVLILDLERLKGKSCV